MCAGTLLPFDDLGKSIISASDSKKSKAKYATANREQLALVSTLFSPNPPKVMPVTAEAREVGVSCLRLNGRLMELAGCTDKIY